MLKIPAETDTLVNARSKFLNKNDDRSDKVVVKVVYQIDDHVEGDVIKCFRETQAVPLLPVGVMATAGQPRATTMT